MKRFLALLFGAAVLVGASAAKAQVTVSIANAGTTGTTLNKLAKLTGAPSTALIAATTDTGGVIGIVISGAGTSGNALIARSGIASCVFDGATTAGDYVQISSSTAGDCHDTGAATYPTSGQVLGRVLSTNGAGGTYSMTVTGPEVQASSGGAISCPTGFSASGASCKWTLTANNSATNLAWTGLANDNYHLVCNALTPATDNNIISIQFGEGGTPTWKTASYDSSELFLSATSTFPTSSFSYFTNTAKAGFYTGQSIHNASGGMTNLSADFQGLSQAVAHSTTYRLTLVNSAATEFFYTGGGIYTGDTTAITAIRLITDNGSGATNGNLSSGSCTLYYDAN